MHATRRAWQACFSEQATDYATLRIYHFAGACPSYATSSASRHRRLNAAQSTRAEALACCAYCSIARPRSSSNSSSRSLWNTCAAAGMLGAIQRGIALCMTRPSCPLNFQAWQSSVWVSCCAHAHGCLVHDISRLPCA